MADMMQFDLVSPERKLASVEASQIQLPGMDGDMTVMPNHAPLLTTLRPGVLRVHHAGGVDEYLVTGGFAETTGEGLSVLAEKSVPLADASRDMLDALAFEADEALAAANDDNRTALAMRVNDVKELASQLNL